MALSRLQTVKSDVQARNVNAEPATIVYVSLAMGRYDISDSNKSTDVTTIVNDGTTLANDIATLIKDLQSDPAAASQPDAATVLYVSSLLHYSRLVLFLNH